MTKAFVDTTILTDILLKSGIPRDSALALLRAYAVTELPGYAIKEFKAGPLKNWIWFYNKLTITRSFAKSIEALRRMALTPRRYTTATALEALREVVVRASSISPKELIERYGHRASEDQMLCDRYRLTMKGLILRAWKRRRSVTTSVVLDLSCYKEVAPYQEGDLLINRPTNCNAEPECCLASALRAGAGDLVRLYRTVQKQPAKPENRRRLRALRLLIRTPKRPLTDRGCRDLGDAMFAFFAPADAVILTTNVADHRPLAETLGKKVEGP